MIFEHRIGTHRYLIEDDLVHNIPDREKTLDLEMMRAYTALLEPVFAKFGRIYLLINGSSLFNVDAQARRYLTQWSRGSQVAASAIYGGNLVSRALINLIAAAMQRLGKDRSAKPTNRFAFFATEAEARSWLNDKRREDLATNPDVRR